MNNKRDITKYFNRGRASGYIAGIKKGIKDSEINIQKNKKAIESSAQAIVFSKFKQIPVENASNDLRKAILSLLRVQNYRMMNEKQTIEELKKRNIMKLIIPRINY